MEGIINNTTKVYVVEIGDYSDRYVAGVFSSYSGAVDYIKETVERASANGHGVWDTHSIESYNLDTRYSMRRDRMFEIVGEFKNSSSLGVKEVDYIRSYGPRVFDGEFRTTVFARDEDHALKIAYDQRAKLRAEKLGL